MCLKQIQYHKDVLSRRYLRVILIFTKRQNFRLVQSESTNKQHLVTYSCESVANLVRKGESIDRLHCAIDGCSCTIDNPLKSIDACTVGWRKGK